jgi:hypothetical protein
MTSPRLPPRRRSKRSVGAHALCAAALLLSTAGVAIAGKVDDLSRMLLDRQRSFKVRVQAAQLLGKLGDPAGVRPLSEALADPEKTVRWMAVQALARIGQANAVPALKALLGREKDPWVLVQAEKALLALDHPATSAAPASPGRPRIFLTFGAFSGGSRAADPATLEVLRAALKRELGKLASVTFSLDGKDEKNFGRSGQLGFLIDGNVSRLDGGGAEINCDVKVMVAKWPSKSIILWTSAGAAVQGGGSRLSDVEAARRDCLEASAGQVGEDLMKFFKAQGG